MSKTFRIVYLIILIISAFNFIDAQTVQSTPNLLKNLQFRNIGPWRGGRVTAVAGVNNNPNVYYFGATGGGIFKTNDGGTNWENVSDGFFKTGSVGAIAVADSDPNIIYVGMGESPVRGNVSHGDGVYKSIDGGKTWKHIGLGDTRQIGRIRVHPTNPNLVYVAAMGHLFGNNAERGVFRSKDGGKSWEKVLFRSEKAGAFDLVFDPSNPNVLYTTFWQIKRTPFSLESGGEDSAIYKSIDSGDNWTDISKNAGLPKAPLGKIGITVSPVNTNRVWAMIEAKEGGLYRSDNGGENWILVSNNPQIRQRPWYYSRVYADTQNADTVYITNVNFHKSIDGGRTFSNIETPHGDNHDLWIAPNDNQRMIGGDDGGGHVTRDGGQNWTEQDQATAQFYRVTTDNDFPYNIYGAQQDNSTVKIKSRSNDFGITENNWYDVGGGESGWIAPHPENSDIVFAGSYGGFLTRYDHKSGQSRSINVYPENPMGAGAEAMKYRFQWNFPILFSPHKTDGKYPLYAGGNQLFRSMDEGQSWQAISGDLTTNDKSRQGSSGGPISQDNTSVEYYCTIFTVAESPIKQGVIWTGSDDGLVHVTQDNGKTWTNVTSPEIPKWTQINTIEASPNDVGTAYIAATSYKSDDFKPYLFKTTDYGKTWKKIVVGIPNDAFTRVIREDPNKRGFLYAGTETGLYYSTNDGENWQPLQFNLPIVPITDLAIHKREKDLVVATQGRSFWVLDNLPILYQLADAQKAEATLFKPEDAYRMAGFGGFQLPKNATIGANPPNGAVFHYYLKNKPKQDVMLEVIDASGKVIRKFSGKPPMENAPPSPPSPENLPTEIGLNRFVWNLRLPNATTIPQLIMWAGSLAGPKIVPNNYQIRLNVDGKAVATENFTLKTDPRLGVTQEDLQKQYDFLTKINVKLSETHGTILEIRDLRKQFEDISARLKPEQKDLKDKATEIVKNLTAIEEELMQTKIKSGQDALNYPIKLNNKLAALNAIVGGADYAPTNQSYDVYNDLTSKIDAEITKFKAIKTNEISAFNKMFAEKNLPIITTKN